MLLTSLLATIQFLAARAFTTLPGPLPPQTTSPPKPNIDDIDIKNRSELAFLATCSSDTLIDCSLSVDGDLTTCIDLPTDRWIRIDLGNLYWVSQVQIVANYGGQFNIYINNNMSDATSGKSCGRYNEVVSNNVLVNCDPYVRGRYVVIQGLVGICELAVYSEDSLNTLGAQGDDCDATCNKMGMVCNPHIVTRNTADTIIAAGDIQSCTTGSFDYWTKAPEPCYASNQNAGPVFLSCVGFKDIPNEVSCSGKHNSVRRLCTCDLNGRAWSKACEVHTATCSSVLVLQCPPDLKLDVASAIVNGTNCGGIDVSADAKMRCDGQDKCQIYAPNYSSGCTPGTSTLWINYSCTVPIPCALGEFTCVNGECVDDNTRCDGNQDCTDGSDEFCSNTMTWKTVVRGERISWDLGKTRFSVNTTVGDVALNLSNADGSHSELFSICLHGVPPQYSLENCIDSTPFDVYPQPIFDSYVWSIMRTETHLFIACNGLEMANVSLSNCASYEVAEVTFDSMGDTASNTYGRSIPLRVYDRVGKDQKIDLSWITSSIGAIATYLSTDDIVTKSWVPFDRSNTESSSTRFSVDMLDNSNPEPIANMTINVNIDDFGPSITLMLACNDAVHFYGASCQYCKDGRLTRIKYSISVLYTMVKIELAIIDISNNESLVIDFDLSSSECGPIIATPAANGNLSIEINDYDTLSGFYPSLVTSLGWIEVDAPQGNAFKHYLEEVPLVVAGEDEIYDLNFNFFHDDYENVGYFRVDGVGTGSLSYYISHCQETWEKFNTTSVELLPKVGSQWWLSKTEHVLLIACDGVMILEYQFDSGGESCTKPWSKTVDKIVFWSTSSRMIIQESPRCSMTDLDPNNETSILAGATVNLPCKHYLLKPSKSYTCRRNETWTSHTSASPSCIGELDYTVMKLHDITHTHRLRLR